ncbi:MAG: site-2 protease family protein [Clostridiales bacterium]|nr:site-2 protease family protein [Clostridiales bacterium]
MFCIFTVIIAIIVFGLILIVHEFGHFITAKMSGVLVHEFAIGFGPQLIKYKKGETVYALRLIPLGGAVYLESIDESDDKNPRAFNNVSLWRRIVIASAGAIMNFLFGLIILAVLMFPSKSIPMPIISGFMPGFTLSGQNGFHVGDKITSINGYHILVYGDVNFALSRGEGKLYDVTVLRNDKKIKLNGLPLKKTEYTVNGQKGMYYGFNFLIKDPTFTEKIAYIWGNAIDFARLAWYGLSQLLTGGVSLNEMSGPVGISAAISQTAKRSLVDMWYLVAFISINLAFMNILPLPALDGGRLFFLFIELFRGKPVNPKYENYVHAAGFCMFLLLFFYVTYNDVVRQFFSK